MTASCPKKPNIAEISPHLICALCGGYLIDATTIVECLHSFCKTCIVRYLESSKYCPICEVLVHKTRPLQNIRLDHTLQNIVYKLVPGLFQDEMKRRREFYKDSPTVRSAQTRQEQQRNRIIYAADEKFSVCLELCPDGKIRKPSTRRRRDSKTETPDRRYLLCPANTTIALIKKFMKLKFFLNEKFKVDIFHSDGNLRDHYQLMDVAYIYSYKREGVLQLYYSVQRVPTPTPKIEIVEIKDETNPPMETGSVNTVEHAQRGIPSLDDNRPSSLFSKASLLSNHRIDGNIEHDLSPLELIATVANDLSSYQEGRGLKRKADESELFENDEENSRSSKEIQIQKSIEHAIDICSTNSNHGNPELPDNITLTIPETVTKPCSKSSSRTVSPASSTDSAFKATNKQRCIKTAPNLFENLVNKLPAKKEKPKTTDTASQCEPRPKKPKVVDTTQSSNQHSSRSPMKLLKSAHLPSTLQQLSQLTQHNHLQHHHHHHHHQQQQQQQAQQQQQQQKTQQQQKAQQQQQKQETVPNHVNEKSNKLQEDLHKDDRFNKVNNNNNLEPNGAITVNKVSETKPTKNVAVESGSVVQVVPKAGNIDLKPAPTSSVTCQKTSVIVGQKTAPTQGAGQKTAPTQGTGQKTAPTHGVGQKTAPTLGAGQKTAPTLGVGQKTAPTQGVGQKTAAVHGDSFKKVGIATPAVQTNGFTGILNANTEKTTQQTLNKVKQADKD